MAINRTNLTDTVVTARKFVQVGKDVETAKSKLRAISAAISSSEVSNLMDAVNNLTIDSKITPEEKILLRDEWDSIKSAFAEAESAAISLEIEDSDNFQNLKTAYDNLNAQIEYILRDMNSATIIGNEFSIIFNAYISEASSFNSFMTAAREGIQQKFTLYKCNILATPPEITYEDEVELQAMVVNDTTDVTASLDASDFYWEFSGTSDDEKYNELAKGKKSVKIPAKEIFSSSRFDVRFFAILDIPSL